MLRVAFMCFTKLYFSSTSTSINSLSRIEGLWNFLSTDYMSRFVLVFDLPKAQVAKLWWIQSELVCYNPQIVRATNRI